MATMIAFKTGKPIVVREAVPEIFEKIKLVRPDAPGFFELVSYPENTRVLVASREIVVALGLPDEKTKIHLA